MSLTSPETEVPNMGELNAGCRCDRCNGQALVRVLMGDLELLFCGHHYREHEDALREAGAVVEQDRRPRLTH